MTTGILLCTITAFLSSLLSHVISNIGSVLISLILGMIAGNLITLNNNVKKGFEFSEKKLLPVSIALLGFSINLSIFQKLGTSAFAFILFIMIFTIFLAVFIGKIIKIPERLAVLIGVGNAVCGSAAIAAASKVMDAKDEETGLSVTIVNFLGVLGIFILPVISKIFEIGIVKSGMVIGGTLQAVGHVVAAGYSLGDKIGDLATVIKMGRVVSLAGVLVALQLIYRNKIQKERKAGSGAYSFPLFIVFFVIFSIIATLNIIPNGILKGIKFAEQHLMAVAMAGIGFRIRFKTFLTAGKKAMIVGMIINVFQVVFALLFWSI